MLKLGIIGVGGWGRTHVQGFLALQAEGRVRISAMADVSPRVLDELATQPELKEVRCFADYRDLLAFPGLDAVVVNAPIPLHREITLAALERDVYVLLEKPPVPLLSHLEELIQADRDGRVMVAFQHIYSALARTAKACICQGRLGMPRSVSALGIWPRPTSYYTRAGWAGRLEWEGRPVLDGPCTNAFAHYINLALYLCGGDADSFAAPIRLSGEAYRARPQISSYDTAALSGEIEGGISFAAGFSHASAESHRVKLRVTGEKGELCFSSDCESLLLPDGSTLLGDDGQKAMWRAFVDFAEGDASQNRTPLHTSKPFVLANSLMLQSSGGVHSIPAKYAEALGVDGRTIYAIDDIGQLLRRCTDHSQTLGKAGAAWAVDPDPIDASDFLEDEMLSSLGILADRVPMAVS